MFNTREKKERALGTKLFLKGTRCSSPKCATVRRPTRPGLHGKKMRRAPSEYGQQLQEKQKIQFSYGLREGQLQRIFKEAVKSPGVTGDTVLGLLERRLDNVVFRLGFAPSRSVARQLVGHGHLMINGRKLTTPSYRVRVKDKISIRPQSKEHPQFRELAESMESHDAPVWLTMDGEKKEGIVVSLPQDFDNQFDINRVVDYYSK